MGRVTADGQQERLATDHGSRAPASRSLPDRSFDELRRRHQRRIAATDLIVLLFAVVFSELVWLGTQADTIAARFNVGYTKFGVLLTLAWWFGLRLGRTRSRTALGSSREYQRIFHVTVTMFGVLAIAAVLLKLDLSRGYLAIAFPLGLVGLLFTRRAWQKYRERQFRLGRYVRHVMVIGQVESAREIAGWFSRNPVSGQRVTGVWLPDQEINHDWLRVDDNFIPVLGTARSLKSALDIVEADVVIVSDTEHLGHHGLRDLTWELEEAGVEMLLSPNLLAVTGSRIHMREVGGLPFVHVQEPRYAEAGNWPKLVFDRVGAALVLLLASPVFLVTAIGVKLSSPGPVFYRQERIGRDGEPFPMIKFRSMRLNADAELTRLLDEQGTSDSPLFKVENDPRITRIGHVIRRYSIDELPQLLNVLKGEMSLVGPRPQREAEVALYEDSHWRRLRVRPGMTGLWQVSGRSNLTWDEAIQLDMYYVENWSLMGDLQILTRTVRAVLAKEGAV